jgi:hypothetical protein
MTEASKRRKLERKIIKRTEKIFEGKPKEVDLDVRVVKITTPSRELKLSRNLDLVSKGRWYE